MATDFGTTVGNVLRYLKGDNLIADIDAGFQALAEDVASKMLGYSQDTAAKRPPAGVANRLFRASDTGALQHDTGSAWEQLAVGPRTFTSAPTAGATPGFSYTESGIAYPTACTAAWVGGFTLYNDAGHTGLANAASFNCSAAPSGKNVVVSFQNGSGGTLYPLILLVTLGY